MLQALRNLKNKYYSYLLNTPVGKQEFDNFKISLLLSLILGFILILGVDEEGRFRQEMLGSIATWLLSDKAIYLAIFMIIPLSFWTLLKMALLNIEKSPWFNAVAQLVTGFFYSFGCGVLIFLFASLHHGYEFNWEFLIFGLASNFVGYGLYLMFQTAIQRTATPKS